MKITVDDAGEITVMDNVVVLSCCTGVLDGDAGVAHFKVANNAHVDLVTSSIGPMHIAEAVGIEKMFGAEKSQEAAKKAIACVFEWAKHRGDL